MGISVLYVTTINSDRNKRIKPSCAMISMRLSSVLSVLIIFLVISLDNKPTNSFSYYSVCVINYGLLMKIKPCFSVFFGKEVSGSCP